MTVIQRLSIFAMALAMPLSAFSADRAPVTSILGQKLSFVRISVSLGQELLGKSDPSSNPEIISYSGVDVAGQLKQHRDYYFGKLVVQEANLTQQISSMNSKMAANVSKAGGDVVALEKAQAELKAVQKEMENYRGHWLLNEFSETREELYCGAEKTGFCQVLTVTPGRSSIGGIHYTTDGVLINMLVNENTKMDPIFEFKYWAQMVQKDKVVSRPPYSGMSVFMRASCQVKTVRTTFDSGGHVAIPFLSGTRELSCVLPENRGEIRFAIEE